MTAIKIEGISQKTVQYGQMVTITSGKNKYSFFDTKKDGSFTKAFEQYQKYRFAIGDTVNCEVKEEPQTGTDKKTGGSFTYVQRTILFFEEVENVPTHVSGALPVATKPKLTPMPSRADAITAELTALKARVSNIVKLNNLTEKVEEPEIPGYDNDDLPF